MIWVLWVTIMATLMPMRGSKGCNQGDMLPLLKRHEIQVLLDAGFSTADVARRSDTSVDTVRRVRREARVAHTDDREPPAPPAASTPYPLRGPRSSGVARQPPSWRRDHLMVPENLLHTVPENLRPQTEGSVQDDLGAVVRHHDRDDAHPGSNADIESSLRALEPSSSRGI